MRLKSAYLHIGARMHQFIDCLPIGDFHVRPEDGTRLRVDFWCEPKPGASVLLLIMNGFDQEVQLPLGFESGYTFVDLGPWSAQGLMYLAALVWQGDGRMIAPEPALDTDLLDSTAKELERQ